MRVDRTWLDVAGRTRFEWSAFRRRLTASSRQWVVMLWRVYVRVFEVVGIFSCISSLSVRDTPSSKGFPKSFTRIATLGYRVTAVEADSERYRNALRSPDWLQLHSARVTCSLHSTIIQISHHIHYRDFQRAFVTLTEKSPDTTAAILHKSPF